LSAKVNIPMRRIALLSDTHGFIDDQIVRITEPCDEVWHAGDIGNLRVTDALRANKPLRAVWGNIDGTKARAEFPEHDRFMCEEVDVWMTHIGGYPKRYDIRVREEIKRKPPRLFICGHSHILKVMFDKELGLLHMNPGAAGKHGFHKIRTMLRFSIDGEEIKDLEVVELGKR
jgi:putative phosphoesterase